MAKRILRNLGLQSGIKEAREADTASKEREQYKKDIRNKGEEAFKLIKTNNKKGIIFR